MYSTRAIPEECRLVGNRRRVLYCIPDPFNANHYIKVEFSNDYLFWAEVRLLDRTENWDPEGPQWEIFRPATAELGCDNYLTELTAE